MRLKDKLSMVIGQVGESHPHIDSIFFVDRHAARSTGMASMAGFDG